MTTNSPNRRYRDSYRRILIDMHIPDWDERFLAKYDPAAAVAAAAKAGANALMTYFQSHVGLCYWPTESGQQHRAFLCADPMAETMNAAAHHDLPVCAYYSVNFNNWAYLEHPDWRLVPAVKGMIGGGLLQRERYGLCCFNHPGYRAFVREQATEILEGYAVDALFYDMVWWMSICECDSCHDRYRQETGQAIPRKIDWLDTDWCRYQVARERWVTELAIELRELAQQIRPDVDVYHNFALGMTNWTRGVAFDSTDGHDFLGGDFYGGRDEQLVISRLMLNLSASRPVEFMTSVATNLSEHEQLKSVEQLRTECLAATASGSAFLMIAPVDPDGCLNPGMLDSTRATFDVAQPFERFLGGLPVEDIGVYFSSESKMSFADNGLDIANAPIDTAMEYPHFDAVRGACRALQRAHLPFGVITRKQLAELNRYRVVVLPNILRMDAEEVDAIRAYVASGGHVYASGCTSLTTIDGVRCDDFMLADVFGCQFDAIEDGLMIHIEPKDFECRAAIAPQRYLSRRVERSSCMPRLGIDPTGDTLASLALPLGYPSTGYVDRQDWSSIHSSPPWEATDHPVIVEQSFGAGRSVYSAVDLESGASTEHDALFLHLIERLEVGRWSFQSDGHPAVWMTMFDQPEYARCIVSILHYPLEFPALPITRFAFSLTPPPGRRFQRLTTLPSEIEYEAIINKEGSLEAVVDEISPFRMFAACYETSGKRS